jgi:glycerate dehydrogenase
MQIVVLDGHTLNPGDLSWSGVERMGDLVVYERTSPELVVERIGDAEAVFTNKTELSREIFERCPRLKFVCVLATGYNVVDVAAAKEHGVVVSNIPTYGTASVAQFAMALLLELCHHAGTHTQDVRAGGWAMSADWCYWLNPTIELRDKTLGVVGFGRIGQAFGRIGQALGMKVLAYDAHQDESLESDTLQYATLDELYAQSDVISLHCPLFDNNRGMINKIAIAKMKPNVFLINTSRGPLIIEQDLADALNKGWIAGAALDVLCEEPPRSDNPLLTARNCLVTPHMAWATTEARQRMMKIVEENLSSFLSGGPRNVVNP